MIVHIVRSLNRPMTDAELSERRRGLVDAGFVVTHHRADGTRELLRLVVRPERREDLRRLAGGDVREYADEAAEALSLVLSVLAARRQARDPVLGRDWVIDSVSALGPRPDMVDRAVRLWIQRALLEVLHSDPTVEMLELTLAGRDAFDRVARGEDVDFDELFPPVPSDETGMAEVLAPASARPEDSKDGAQILILDKANRSLTFRGATYSFRRARERWNDILVLANAKLQATTEKGGYRHLGRRDKPEEHRVRLRELRKALETHHPGLKEELLETEARRGVRLRPVVRFVPQ